MENVMSRNYPISTASDTLTRGDAVVGYWHAAMSRWEVKRANASTLAVMPTCLGVVTDFDVPLPGYATIALPGEVADNSITGLNTGGSLTANIVAVDPNVATRATNLIRVEHPNGSEFVVGTTDPDGNLTIQPRASRDTSAQHVYNVCSYGAVADGKTFVDAYIDATSNVLLSPSGPFTPDDASLSKNVCIVGAGTGGADLVTSILSYTSATEVTLNTTAITKVVGQPAAVWLTDNNSSISAAATAAATTGGTVFFPPGVYVVASDLNISGPNIHFAFDAGAVLAPADATVTIEGKIKCHPHQYIFGCAGAFALADSSLPAFAPFQWGAPWDGLHDDLPSWKAMLAAIPSDGARIDLPPGMGYFSDNLHLNKPVRIYGRAGGNNKQASGFIFPAGRGIFCNGTNVVTPPATQGSDAFDYGGLHDVNIVSQLLIQGDQTYQLSNTRVPGPGTYVELGYVVRAITLINNVCFFRCTQAGTTSATPNVTFEPGRFDDTTPGHSYADGGVVWTSEKYPTDYVPGNSYYPGDRVFIAGDVRYYWECESTGGPWVAALPSEIGVGGMLPRINPLIGGVAYAGVGALFSDPGSTPADLQWRVHTHAGIVLTAAECVFSSVNFVGFTGYAFTIQNSSSSHDDPDEPDTYGDATSIITGSATHCGGGILLFGESNGCTAHNFNTVLLGEGRTPASSPRDTVVGTGAHTVWDMGLANTFVNLYSQYTVAPAYRLGPLSSAVMVGCRSENTRGTTHFNDLSEGGGPAVLGNNTFSLIDTTTLAPANTGLFLLPDPGGRGLQEKVAASSGEPDKFAQISQDWGSGLGSLFNMWTPYEYGAGGSLDRFGWWYENGHDPGGSIGTGTFAFALGAQNFTQSVGVIGMAGKNTATGVGPGVGLYRMYRGFFAGQGDPASIPYQGTEPTMLTDARLRYGARVVGDYFPTPSTVAPGGWMGTVCTSAGYRAPPFNFPADYTGAAEQDNIGVEALQREPTGQPLIYSDGTGQVWRCLGGGVTGTMTTMEPAWVPPKVTDNAGNTWQYVGQTAVFKPAGAIGV
jgi:hypothetical protein